MQDVLEIFEYFNDLKSVATLRLIEHVRKWNGTRNFVPANHFYGF